MIEYFQKSKKNQKRIKILIKKNKQVEKETQTLRLNANKAKKILNWKNKYNLKKTVDSILVWNELVKTNSKFNVCVKFVKDYLK